jgi:hypothetical protein
MCTRTFTIQINTFYLQSPAMGNEDRGIACAHDIVSVFFWILLSKKLILILLKLVVEFCGVFLYDTSRLDTKVGR